MGLLKKITKPFKKVVKKLVPKELAGIMQVAAPLAGPYAPLVYAAGAYKQSGRINPMALVLNKLKIAPAALTSVTVILAPDPASSDTKIDLITDVLNDGTV